MSTIVENQTYCWSWFLHSAALHGLTCVFRSMNCYPCVAYFSLFQFKFYKIGFQFHGSLKITTYIFIYHIYYSSEWRRKWCLVCCGCLTCFSVFYFSFFIVFSFLYSKKTELRNCSAAPGLVAFNWTTLINFHLAGCFGCTGWWSDAVLNFGCHGHECLFDIGCILGRCLKEWDAQLLRVFL